MKSVVFAGDAVALRFERKLQASHPFPTMLSVPCVREVVRFNKLEATHKTTGTPFRRPMLIGALSSNVTHKASESSSPKKRSVSIHADLRRKKRFSTRGTSSIFSHSTSGRRARGSICPSRVSGASPGPLRRKRSTGSGKELHALDWTYRRDEAKSGSERLRNPILKERAW
jgi:hypothetical protein